MGAVYLGEHTMLGRPAAIKILLPSLSQNREMVGRFFNEARATTAIRHPGIVEIYDFGFLPDGAAYIAMEMLDGESLASRLQRVGRLPVGAAVDIGRQVAAALHAAHSLGITHRDLKPDNMFLVRDPEIGERVKLLDFGIAKLVTNDSGNRTRTGVVMGTPVYMSPEQCRGTAALDSRADLYSLGCVLYELVAGRPPFVAESAGDIIAHHLYFPPDPVRRHEPSVPDGLEQLIMALLAKDPAMRPGSAAEVSGILDRWRTIAAAPVGSAMHATLVAAAGQTGRQNAANVLTTLSGSAAAVATAAGATGHGPSNKRWVLPAAIGAAVIAAGAIAVVVMTRGPEPSATVAAITPSAATAPAVPATPAVPPPSAVAQPPPPSPAPPPSAAPPAAAASPPAPSPGAPTTPVDRPAAAPAAVDATIPPGVSKPTDEPLPRKPARAAASKSTASGKKSHDTAAAPSEEPKAIAASPPVPATTKSEPKPAATTPEPASVAAMPEPKPAATTPEAKPAAAPAPAEASRKTESKPADSGAPAKPAASKWGHLMGDKNVNVDDYYLLQQCKLAASKGDCASARAFAARLADKNVAMYRARVVTDAAVAACLNAK